MYEIVNVIMGSNCIFIILAGENGETIDFKFFETKKEKIVKTLKIYDINIEEYLKDYIC